MGILGTILGILIPTLLGIGGTWLSNRVNNARLTGAQQEQNTFNAFEAQQQRDWSSGEAGIVRDYNAEQAQIDRDFQAAQAQQQMDFQERMDNTVYQRRVADMQAAGINPALAIGGVSVGSTAGASGTGSAASASLPAGAAASGSSSAFPQSMSDLMQASLMSKNLGLLDSEIQMNDAKAMRDLAEAGLLGEQRIGQQLSNSWFVPMKEQELNKLKSDLQTARVERALKRSNISVNKAEEAFTNVQTAIAHVDVNMREELNRASLRMTLAQAGYYSALDAESRRRAEELIPAEVNELYQRAIMQSLQGGLYSAEELESLERAGMIRAQTAGVEQENAIRSYSVDRKGVTYWVDTTSKVAGIVGSIIGGVAIGKFSGNVGKKWLSGNAKVNYPAVTSFSGKGNINGYYSSGSSLLSNYIQSW